MTDHPSPHGADATLQHSLADLVEESRSLRTDVHAAEDARRLSSLINLGLLAVVAIFVGLLLAIGWQNNRLVAETRRTNDKVADCTTPGRACYEDSRRRTGDAVADILRAELYGIECARLFPGESGPAFDHKLEQCVAERLAATRQTQPTPAPSQSPGKGR